MYEGTITSLFRSGNGMIYNIRANTVMCVEGPDDEDDDIIEGEATVIVDGVEVNRDGFQVLIEGNSTCGACGLDLKFVDGHESGPGDSFICVDCVDAAKVCC